MLFQHVATNIGQHDQVEIFPTFGRLTCQGEIWQIPITGSVSEGGDACRRKRLWLELLQKLNKFHPNDEQRELFERRMRAFLAPTERGKRLVLQIGDQIYPLNKTTKRNGLFTSTLQIPVSTTQELERDGQVQEGWLHLDVILPNGHKSGFRGPVRLMEPTGISVISDIDDTVKVTQVNCRRSLLENTFLREFEAVKGMAHAYRRWSVHGAAFHYVSSSPWQLFAPLSELFEREGLPLGTFHLSSFGFRDQIFRKLWMLRRRAKISVLKSVLEFFPLRRFVMVGDSGERDPEMYGALARRFGQQIHCIYIRELPHRPMTRERIANAFATLAPCRVQVFREPEELPHRPV